MPLESQLAHRNIRSTNLPYKSNISPTDTDPCYIPGSQDFMTSIIGYAERRPGFADNLETVVVGLNDPQRVFLWDRFDGTFIAMAVNINSSSQSEVYKMILGTDPTFVLLFTDTSSNSPFDFIVSNNSVYFSNGNTAKKWDPNNGVTNWGISAGSGTGGGSIYGPTGAGTGTDQPSGFTVAWANPGNITAGDSSFATATVSAPTNPGTHFLQASNFGFAVAAGSTITGIQVEVKGFQSSVDVENISVQLTKSVGSPTGTYKTAQLPTSNGFISLGDTSDLWGGTYTLAETNDAGFGCVIFANTNAATATFSIDFVRITVFATTGSVVTLSGTGLTANIGYQYVYCYGNSRTGHVSSPTPPSNVVKPANQQMNIPVVASGDPQVNQIRLFRSTDSVAPGFNAGVYFELPTSPYPNTSTTLVDTAIDTSLIVNSVAPIAGFNDPPTPFMAPVYFAGRIWGFKNNQVFYSGLEETLLGVPEESFVSGPGGNFWNFDEPVQALAVAGTGLGQALMIFCGGRIYGITGNSLDTFRKFLISNRRGCRSLTCVSSLGGMVAWLDSSMQVWVTDGNSLQEISVDIRPDLLAQSQVGASMTFHTAGKFHWLVLAFEHLIYVYDMDLEQWMPPWNISSNYVFSGETSAGVYDLLLATYVGGTGPINTGKILKLSLTAHNDDGTAYTPVLKTNLFSVVPDFGKRFSYAGMGTYDEPTRTGYPTGIHVDTNAITLRDVLLCSDDDPFNAATPYTSVFTNKVSPSVAYNRPQGLNLVQSVFPMTKPEAHWIGMKIIGQTADDDLKIYTVVLSYKTLGGR